MGETRREIDRPWAFNQPVTCESTLTVNGQLTVAAGLAFEVGDDDRFTLGDDNDQVLVNRSASLLANTGVTGVLDGTPVSPGKRLTSSFFASAKDEEKLRMTGRKLKNLLLALHNIPLDGKEDAAYQALPTAEKILRTGPLSLSLSAFEPPSKWEGTKVMVQVKTGKDMDGEPRNEFALLAASTKPVERKPRT